MMIHERASSDLCVRLRCGVHRQDRLYTQQASKQGSTDARDGRKRKNRTMAMLLDWRLLASSGIAAMSIAGVVLPLRLGGAEHSAT